MWVLKPGMDLCNALDSLAQYLAPDRALRPQNNHLIAPRLGLAWDPKGDGKMVFRAGIGQFFQRDRVAIDESGAANTPFVLDGRVHPLTGCCTAPISRPRERPTVRISKPQTFQIPGSTT